MEEQAADRADARVSGSTRAWIKAFSPEGDRSELEVTGSRKLAGELLDGLALAAPGGAAATRAA